MTTRSGKKSDRDENKNEISSNDQKIDNVIILKYLISV